jgi:hypothetical protein
MKRSSILILIALLIAAGFFAVRASDPCGDWQRRYERFLEVESMKNSPIIYTPEMVEEVIGERPSDCGIPESDLLEEANS